MDFHCENDPETSLPVDIQFTSRDFVEVEKAQSLGMFKLAAMNDPQLSLNDALKYQVLTD